MPTTVDEEGVAGDVTAVVTCQEGRNGADVVEGIADLQLPRQIDRALGIPEEEAKEYEAQVKLEDGPSKVAARRT